MLAQGGPSLAAAAAGGGGDGSARVAHRGASGVDGGDHGVHVGHDALELGRGLLLAALGLVPAALGGEDDLFALGNALHCAVDVLAAREHEGLAGGGLGLLGEAHGVVGLLEGRLHEQVRGQALVQGHGVQGLELLHPKLEQLHIHPRLSVQALQGGLLLVNLPSSKQIKE